MRLEIKTLKYLLFQILCKTYFIFLKTTYSEISPFATKPHLRVRSEVVSEWGCTCCEGVVGSTPHHVDQPHEAPILGFRGAVGEETGESGEFILAFKSLIIWDLFFDLLRNWDEAIPWDVRFAVSYSLRFQIVKSYLLRLAMRFLLCFEFFYTLRRWILNLHVVFIKMAK